MRGTGYSGPWAEVFFYVGAVAAVLWGLHSAGRYVRDWWKGGER